MSSTPLYTSDKPVFDKEKITVVFVLGGPGAGASESRRVVAEVGAASLETFHSRRRSYIHKHPS